MQLFTEAQKGISLPHLRTAPDTIVQYNDKQFDWDNQHQGGTLGHHLSGQHALFSHRLWMRNNCSSKGVEQCFNTKLIQSLFKHDTLFDAYQSLCVILHLE